MKKLIRVKRPGRTYEFFMEGMRRHPEALPGRAFDPEEEYTNNDYFLVDERDVEVFLETMAKRFPGCDIEQYKMEQVGHCPAGDFAKKKVTDDGILPA